MFGYFRRVKNSFAAMFVGLIMVPGSVCLHGWNEYRTVHRARGLAEATKLVQSIPDSQRVDDSLEQKLVHLTGFADTQDFLEDDQFSVRERAIHLKRQVEMFQWIEEKESRGNNNDTHYSYRKEWREDREDSSRFHEAAGHENPLMAVHSVEKSASNVVIGAYRLSTALRDDMRQWEPVQLNQSDVLGPISEEQRTNYVVSGSQILWSKHGQPQPDSPQIGDLRIEFKRVVPATVSLVAQQRGSSFGDFRTSNGEAISRLYMGELNAADVMLRLVSENNVLAWILRIVGVVLSILGFSLTLRPISSMVSFLPFVGNLTQGLLFVVAMLLGLILSSTTIAISWIAVRPLLGIGLLALAAMGLAAILRIRKNNPTKADLPPVIDSSMIVE